MTKLKTCHRCKLHETRTNIVWGSGPMNSPIKIVGEGPGREEDESGIPFVGRSGKLLRFVLSELGGDQVFNHIFITNIVMCRPPNNRNPEPEEIAACDYWLQHKLMTHRPKAIGCIGKVSADHLLGASNWEWNGVYRKKKILFIPVYHPAYILRNGEKMGDFKIGISRLLRKGGI